MQTLEFTKGLKIGFRPIDQGSTNMSWLSASQVYRYPTIETLAEFLNRGLKLGISEETVDSDERRAERMTALVEKYTKGLPETIHTNGISQSNGEMNGNPKLNVALTGSTGTLGTHLLEALLKDTAVGKVYCLNRSSEAQARQEKSFEARGISELLDMSRLSFLTVGLGHAQLGLSSGSFTQLMSGIDVIIHNAWKVDFNHQLESYESQIRAVSDFAKWSASSRRHLHIVFVSSLASVGNWSAHNQGPIPETPVTDAQVAQRMGYGESKHVAERILQYAQEQCSVPATILRVGQIAGPSTAKGGVWNKAEWLPTLIQTSKALGCIPDNLPVVNWIPVDHLAHIILELTTADISARRGQIYNLVNPNTVEWSSLLPPIQSYFQPSTALSLVSMEKWMHSLQAAGQADNKDYLAAIPAAKIINFYADMALEEKKMVYETGHGVKASHSMATLGPVTKDLMRFWLEGWAY